MPSTTPNTGTLLVRGFCQWLAGQGLLDWDQSAASYTTATEWPTFEGPDMPTSPDRLIVATATDPTRLRADITQGVQLRFRGSRDALASEVQDQAQAIMNVCYPNGFPRVHVDLGTVQVGVIRPGAEGTLGRDQNRRHAYVMNFTFRFRQPRPVVEPVGLGEGPLGDGGLGI